MSDHITDAMVEQAAAAEWASEWPERDFSREPDDLRDTYTRSAHAALDAVLPGIVQAAKAEALRDAAEALNLARVVGYATTEPESLGRWLRARADRIEQGGQP